MARMSNHARRSGAASDGQMLKIQRVDLSAACPGREVRPDYASAHKTIEHEEELNSH
jgi:hypothetical protein